MKGCSPLPGRCGSPPRPRRTSAEPRPGSHRWVASLGVLEPHVMSSLNAATRLLERPNGVAVSILGNLFGTPSLLGRRWERALRRSGRALRQPRPSWPRALAGYVLDADFV